MTTYALTNQAETYTGGNGADFFAGPSGGNDTIKGRGGNDTFDIQSGQTGLIDGGSGYDRVHLVGPGLNNQLSTGLTLVGIEELIVDSTNLYASAAQIGKLQYLGVNNNNDQFYIFLRGNGGTLDFSRSYAEPAKLYIESEMVNSAVKIIGSAHNDDISGSDFADKLNGFSGKDTVRGQADDDFVNGGLGNDHIEGGDGLDHFVFNTKLGSTNIDHIMDFRHKDDDIRIDHDIFKWSGQSLGTLQEANFQLIGNGQTMGSKDHILYNEETGRLFFDPDGSGDKPRVQFATLDNFSGDIPILEARDIIIV